jgi:hypothetical protein
MNKYRAVKCEMDGIRFDSLGERECYTILKLLQGANKIKDLRVHVTTHLLPRISHKTDFCFFDIQKQCLVWAEFKGMETERWRVIKKLWSLFGPGPLRVFKQIRHRISQVEEIRPVPTGLLGPERYCLRCGQKKIQRSLRKH